MKIMFRVLPTRTSLWEGELGISACPKAIIEGGARNFFKSQCLYSKWVFYIISSYLSHYFLHTSLYFPHVPSYSFIFSLSNFPHTPSYFPHVSSRFPIIHMFHVFSRGYLEIATPPHDVTDPLLPGQGPKFFQIPRPVYWGAFSSYFFKFLSYCSRIYEPTWKNYEISSPPPLYIASATCENPELPSYVWTLGLG